MSTQRDWATPAMLIAILIVLALLFSALAEGQAGGTQVISEEDALARTAVREAGMRAYARDDTAAIDAVVSFRAEHIYRSSWLEGLLRATRGAPLRTHGERPWIGQLYGTARPALFPRHLRWEGRHAIWWARTRQHAREVLRGEVEHRCEQTPHTWGDERDAVRYQRSNPDAVRIDCGNTCGPDHCNVFFHLPRYELRFGTN